MTESYQISQCEQKRLLSKQARQDKLTSYYVYAHRKVSDDEIFYVGKGKGKRAWESTGRNIYWERVAKKHGCYVDIVFCDLSDSEAYELEHCVIQELLYFEKKLTNLTEGGAGGLNPSEETRKKQSLAKKGKRPPNFGKKLPSVAMDNNGCADLKVYNFKHQDGTTYTGTRYDLVRKFSLDLANIGKLFYNGSGKRNRIYGWSILEDNNAN